MNTHFYGFDIQSSNQICPIHKTEMLKLGGHINCKQCSIDSVAQSQKEHAHAVNTMVRKKHFEGAQIPSRHADSGFGNYMVQNNGQQHAKAQCASFVKDFNSGVKRNLIMVGRTGTGKTHLACASARNILDKGKYARYVTSEDMANEIANAWTKADDSEAGAIYRFTDVDLLILDEYGLHDRFENRLQLVHKVLYARYDACKPTMLISNMTRDELVMDLGDRLWSRFQHDGLTVVECNWADSRTGGTA
ncbi:ATP-binding protein [Acinetobacter sp. 1207_04]|uniref:ATP-binding protein n=1 Tax=Acinetobacter sp. 1207_04 TaxID=2604449 RepID=UPI004057DA9D